MKLPSFYPIFDTAAAARLACAPIEAAKAIIDAGAGILQFRHKEHLTREAFDLAASIEALCRAAGARFVINDRADLARLFNCTLHLGQDDLPPDAARRVTGPDLPIGLSTHNHEQLVAANTAPVDYHALGPIFATASKHNPDPVVGLAGLRGVRPLSNRPVVAIGGIALTTCREVLDAGADSVAVINGVLAAGADALTIAHATRAYLAACTR